MRSWRRFSGDAPGIASIMIAGVIAGACSKSAPTPTSSEITGTFTVDEKPVTVNQCRPGRAEHTFVEVITSSGVLRFEHQQLYWNPDRHAATRGARLTCSKLDRSWGGGHRANGTSYWRGTLDFRCGALAGKLELDCGNITDEERQGLDRGRTEALDEQRSETP